MPRRYCNNLRWCVITHYDYIPKVPFVFQYRLLTMITFFEIAVHDKCLLGIRRFRARNGWSDCILDLEEIHNKNVINQF